MIEDGGGVEEATKTRVKCAWGKFRKFTPILTNRGVPFTLKGKIYQACVQSVMVYGSETLATKVADMHRLSRAEMMMVRWMCGVSLKERKPNQELLGRLGIVCVTEVVRRSRLRWFGHLERKCGAGWVTNCRDLVVDGDRCRGRGRKTWSDCVEEDMIRLGLKREDVHKREEWRKGIHGVRLTRASAEKTDVKRR